MNALLGGLEASISKKSQLERTLRIDAEYFKKRFLNSAEVIGGWKRDNVAKLALVSDGNHFAISDDFVSDGVPYYRGQDVTGRFFVETSAPIHITQEAFERRYMRRSYLKQGDVLLSIVGTIGELSLVASERSATCSCKLAILRPHKIRPELLAVFLRSQHGQNQIERLTRGAVQRGLLLEDLDQLWVPQMSSEFEKRVAAAVRSAREMRNSADAKQREGEETVLSSLRLHNWKPPEPLSYTVRLTDLLQERRLDAQFHRPKYQELKAAHEAHFALHRLGGVVLKGRTVEYADDGQVPIIRSGDVSDFDDETRLLKASAEEPIFYLKKGDVLISSIGFGSIGKVQVFDKPGKFGTVSEVTVIRQTQLNSYYLAAYLRSELGQLQIDRYITGATGQLHLYPRDVEKFFIPIIPEPQQAEFQRLHNEKRQLASDSLNLLEAAKRCVEIALEHGEPAALAFLDEKEGVH